MSVDKAGAIRPGEEVPMERLQPWLAATLPGAEGTPEVTQYSGGASNWTYRLEYPEADLILRRPPDGTKAKGAHDMGREYRLQKALKPVFQYVPEMLAYTDDTVSRRNYTVRFKNLTTGKFYPEIIEGTSGDIAWADDATVFYIKNNLLIFLVVDV